MKPFNLERALAGDPVITRAGDPVTQITCFEGVSYGEHIFGVHEERVSCWQKDGYFINDGGTHPNDLFMAKKLKVGWTNIYLSALGSWRTYGPIYDTEKEALDQNQGLSAVRIEWEVP